MVAEAAVAAKVSPLLAVVEAGVAAEVVVAAEAVEKAAAVAGAAAVVVVAAEVSLRTVEEPKVVQKL